jgi:Domain of unknown function (DUF4272)
MADDDDLDDEMRFKTQEEVAWRALALVALTYRVSMDSLARTDPHQKSRWDEILTQLRDWVSQQGIEPHLSPTEREALNQRLGRIDDDTLFDLSWRLQALVAVLWALNGVEPMPSYAESYPADALQPLLPFGRPVGEFLATVRLRAEEELVAERHRAEFWNWRAQTDVLRRRGAKPPAGQTYDAILARAAESAREDGIVPEVRQGDVVCQGVPYSGLSQEAFADAASTAQERHFALNWICGYAEDWDETPTDT